MSEAMSPVMSETPSPVQVAAPSDPSHEKAAFTYCCECGTYDAHTTRCTCCGFDFRVETPKDEAWWTRS